jgi:hypothetical protein
MVAEWGKEGYQSLCPAERARMVAETSNGFDCYDSTENEDDDDLEDISWKALSLLVFDDFKMDEHGNILETLPDGSVRMIKTARAHYDDF